MNYYSKLQKYIQKYNNYSGGAEGGVKPTNDKIKFISFKEDGYDKLVKIIGEALEVLEKDDLENQEKDLAKLKELEELSKNALSSELHLEDIGNGGLIDYLNNTQTNNNNIDFPDILEENKQEFINKLQVLNHFQPRFDELWREIYLDIMKDPSEFYNLDDELKENKYSGILIFNSIYNELKRRYKFKDGDDICIYGYSQHGKRQCKNFNGISESRLNKMRPPGSKEINLLHWPDKPCPRDNDKPAGCGLHRDSNTCSFLHTNTYRTYRTGHGDKYYNQIQFEIIKTDRKKIPPVVYFKGFELLPKNGQWAQKKPFIDETIKIIENKCMFKIDDYVKLIFRDNIREELNLPEEVKYSWIFQITKLNYDADKYCVSARVKIGKYFDDIYKNTNEVGDTPANNNINITSPEMKSTGLPDSFIYFRKIDIDDLKKSDPPSIAPIVSVPIIPVPEKSDEEKAIIEINNILKELNNLKTNVNTEISRYIKTKEEIKSLTDQLKERGILGKNEDKAIIEIKDYVKKLQDIETKIDANMVLVNKGLIPIENILKNINDKIVNKSINKIILLVELKNKEILEKQTDSLTKLSNLIIPKRIQNDKDVITIKDSINNILSKLASQPE